MASSTTRNPTSLVEALDVASPAVWQMAPSARLILKYLVMFVRPAVAIEIGTAQGGSLQCMAQFCEKIYSCDIDHGTASELPHLQNVVLVTGDSRVTVPEVVNKIISSGEILQFVLIDGDHSREGVRHDIESVLAYEPSKPMYILMHDSFNPDVREGIKSAHWSRNQHVHFLELDFVPGSLHFRPDIHRQMWGGFALAVLYPEARESPLEVVASQELLFRTVVPHSAHATGLASFIRRLLFRVGG